MPAVSCDYDVEGPFVDENRRGKSGAKLLRSSCSSPGAMANISQALLIDLGIAETRHILSRAIPCEESSSASEEDTAVRVNSITLTTSEMIVRRC